MNCEIIAVGSELLSPYRQDTNSLFLTDRLLQLGVNVVFKTIVGDRLAHLAGAIRIALGRTDIVITMGGLGPTEDDLTRQAVAEALGIRLRRHPEIVGALYARFAARRAQMTENNARQADVLDGSVVLENGRGTAPGQWLDTVYGEHRKLVILLPGPPSEVKAMFDAQCMDRLRAVVPPRTIATRTLKIAMIGESQADARIAPILAHTGDITLILNCSKGSQEAAQARVDELAGKIEEELEEYIYSSHGESLEQIVLYYLGMHASTLAVAESCTGGLVAQRLTSISGSSRSFLGGAVVYSDRLKSLFAGVPPSMIEAHGAVSKEVAVALAEGIRNKTSATFGLGVTGIAGPSGGSEEKPIGLVYVAVADGKQTDAVERRFGGDREHIRSWTSQLALDMVRRRLK
jgi:nicotinamide-nucleotide amidase